MECLICGSDNIEFLTDAGTKFTVEKSNICLNCGLVFLHPTMDNVEEYYLSDSFSNDFRGSSEPDEEKRRVNKEVARVRWDAIHGAIEPGESILEIGCSSGEFLNLASEFYQFAYGIDASSGFANSAKGSFDIEVGFFPDDVPDTWGKFDTIASFHTLEHVPNPRGFLSAVYNKLHDGGEFVLEYPDISRASLRAMLPPTYFQKSHLFDFSVFNIVPLLKQEGFEILSFATYDGYPRDKNVLLICKKAEPSESIVYDTISAKELYERLEVKIKSVATVRKKELKIMHVASHHINVGDGAITAGIRNTISQIYSGSVRYVNFDIVDYGYFGTEISAEFINGYEPDLVIVGGGGTIDGHVMRTQNGTAFTMAMEEIDKLKAPICFVGLGHNQYRYQEFYHSDILTNFLSFCQERGIPFSVRDDGSFERLEKQLKMKLGDCVTTVPDPGFFVRVPEEMSSPMFTPQSPKNVVIQIAMDAYKHRFGGDETDFEQNALDFIDRMGKYVLYLIDTHGASIALATHTLSDIDAALMIMRGVDHKKSRMHIRTTGVYHPVYAQMFFRTYFDADLIVGMRGHSVICGTGLATPTIAISTHDKVEGFMRKADLPHWIFEPPFSDKEYDRLIQQTDKLLGDYGKTQVERVALATETWNDDLKSFLTRCLNAI